MGHRLTIEYGDDVLFSVGLSREEFDQEARFLLAAKLYELGKLTSGQAAALCGKGRVDFILSLPRVGVSISNLRPEDAEVEIEFSVPELFFGQVRPGQPAVATSTAFPGRTFSGGS